MFFIRGIRLINCPAQPKVKGIVLAQIVKNQRNTPLTGFRQFQRHLSSKNEASTTLQPALVRWTKDIWSKMFGKYLLLTNTISSGLLMVVGDIAAQEYEYQSGLRSDQEEHYDADRMYRMFVTGAVQGPLHHYVYRWMDLLMPQRTFKNTINKILIDQLFMSPVCIVLFFYTLCYLERKTMEATKNELYEKFTVIYMLDWMTWPAAQYINFRYLDTKYRVSFVNVCTAAYNVLISYIKHSFGSSLPIEIDSNLVENAGKNPPKGSIERSVNTKLPTQS